MPLALGAGPNQVKSLPATTMAGAVVSRKRIRALDCLPVPTNLLVASPYPVPQARRLVAAHTAPQPKNTVMRLTLSIRTMMIACTIIHCNAPPRCIMTAPSSWPRRPIEW